MRGTFSPQWVGSRQPRKQRKYRAQAPSHVRGSLMSAHLAKPLKAKYGRRSFPLRKGDTVKIMRGEFKGKTGKIDRVNRNKLKAIVEGIYRAKKDGTKLTVLLDPSVLQIQELVLTDAKRVTALERSKKIRENTKHA